MQDKDHPSPLTLLEKPEAGNQVTPTKLPLTNLFAGTSIEKEGNKEQNNIDS